MGFFKKKTQQKYAMNIEQLRTHIQSVICVKQEEKHRGVVNSMEAKETNLEIIAKTARLQGYIDALGMVLWWTRKEEESGASPPQ